MSLLGGVVGRSFPSPSPANPGMSFAHFSNGPGLNKFNYPSEIVTGMNLGTHLGLDASLGRRFGNDATFMNVTGQRFLAIDVLSRLQGGEGGECTSTA